MLRCNECILRYEIIWHYDGDDSPCNYCPRCGSDDLEEEGENAETPD